MLQRSSSSSTLAVVVVVLVCWCLPASGLGTTMMQRIASETMLGVAYLSRSVVVVEKPAGLRSVPAFGPSAALVREHAERLAVSDPSELSALYDKGSRRERRAAVAASLEELPQAVRRRASGLPRTRAKFVKFCTGAAGGFMSHDESVRAWALLRQAIDEAERADGFEESDSVLVRIRKVFQEACPVHRLDRATSGLLAIALDDKAAAHLSRQWAQRTVHKGYEAVVDGTVDQDAGELDFPLLRIDAPLKRRGLPSRMAVVPCGTPNAKPCRTSFRVRRRRHHSPNGLAASPGERGQVMRLMTHLDLVPHTGRLHQLRAHLAHFGHPILGDDLYPSPFLSSNSDLLPDDDDDNDDSEVIRHATTASHLYFGASTADGGGGPGRLCLHANRLSFTDPDSNRRVDLLSPADWSHLFSGDLDEALGSPQEPAGLRGPPALGLAGDDGSMYMSA